MHELIYTSVPKGLSGVGFCTVACTRGTRKNLVRTLEQLSDYRRVDGLSDNESPVCYSLLRPNVGDVRYAVLSRIAAYGMDYSQRTNMLAHHIALGDKDLKPLEGDPPSLNLDPVFLLERRRDLLRTDWTAADKPDYWDERQLPKGKEEAAKCERWKSLVGDAGWGGYLAHTAGDSSVRHVTLVFEPGQNQKVLPLVLESLRLLEVEKRWQVTFSTYFTKLPPGIDCKWRFVLKDSGEARRAQNTANTPVIDLWLGHKLGAPPITGGLIEAAQTGVLPARVEGGTDSDEWFDEDAILGEEVQEEPIYTGDDLDQIPGQDQFEGEVETAKSQLVTGSDRRRATRRQKPSSNPIVVGAIGAIALAFFGAAIAYLVVFLPSGGSGPKPDETSNGGSTPDVKRLAAAEQRRAEEKKEIEEIGKRIQALAPLRNQADENKQHASQIGSDNEYLKQSPAWNTQIEELKNDIRQAKDSKDQEQLRELVQKAEDLKQSIGDAVTRVEKKITEVRDVRARLQEETGKHRSWYDTAKKERTAVAVMTRLNELRTELGSVERLLAGNEYKSLDDTLSTAKKDRQNVGSLVAKLQKTTNMAGEPAAKTPPKAKDVFRALAAAVELPEFKTRLNKGGNREEKLLNLYVDDPKDCELSFDGVVTVSGTTFSLSPPKDSQDVRIWDIFRSSDGIAKFFLRNQQLQFVWSTLGSTAESQQLKNCSLKITAGNETRTVLLRRPVDPEEARFSAEETYAFWARFWVPFYPRDCDIVLEVFSQGLPQNEFGDQSLQMTLAKDAERKEFPAGREGPFDPCGAIRHPAKFAKAAPGVFDGRNVKLECEFVEVQPVSDTKKIQERRQLWVRGQLKLGTTARTHLAARTNLEQDLTNEPMRPSWLRKLKGEKENELAEEKQKQGEAKAKLDALHKLKASARGDKKNAVEGNIATEKMRLDSAVGRAFRLQTQVDDLKRLLDLMKEVEREGIQGRIYAGYEKTHEVELARFNTTGKEDVPKQISE